MIVRYNGPKSLNTLKDELLENLVGEWNSRQIRG